MANRTGVVPAPFLVTAAAVAVVGLLVLTALAPGDPPGASTPSRATDAYRPSAASVGPRSAAGALESSASTAGSVPVTLTLSHDPVDIGEPISVRANVPEYPSNYSWDWNVPPSSGLHLTSQRNVLNGTAKSSGRFNISVNVTLVVNAPKPPTYVNGTQNITLTINVDLVVELGAEPAQGVAPLPVDLIAFVSGGTAPYTVSWLTGDRNVGIGRSWNHTYAVAGRYVPQVWVNDSTVAFDPTVGSRFGELNLSVAPPPKRQGPFGLPGLLGWLVVGGFAAVILGGVLYGIGTRNRPKRLPGPEGWMIAGTEGRAGGIASAREPRPPPAPPPPDRSPPAEEAPPGPER